MLQVVRVVVHGIFFRPAELAIWFYISHVLSIDRRRTTRKRIDNLFYYNPQINGVLYPCYYAATRVSHGWGSWGFNFNPSLPHYALLMRKKLPSLAPTFVLSRYHINFRVMIFRPRRSRPCRRRGPFYTLALYNNWGTSRKVAFDEGKRRIDGGEEYTKSIRSSKWERTTRGGRGEGGKKVGSDIDINISWKYSIGISSNIDTIPSNNYPATIETQPLHQVLPRHFPERCIARRSERSECGRVFVATVLYLSGTSSEMRPRRCKPERRGNDAYILNCRAKAERLWLTRGVIQHTFTRAAPTSCENIAWCIDNYRNDTEH